jgi:hypothetical protein
VASSDGTPTPQVLVLEVMSLPLKFDVDGTFRLVKLRWREVPGAGQTRVMSDWFRQTTCIPSRRRFAHDPGHHALTSRSSTGKQGTLATCTQTNPPRRRRETPRERRSPRSPSTCGAREQGTAAPASPTLERGQGRLQTRAARMPRHWPSRTTQLLAARPARPALPLVFAARPALPLVFAAWPPHGAS